MVFERLVNSYRHGLVGRILSSRLIRWPIYIFASLVAFEFILQKLIAFEIIDPDTLEPTSNSPPSDYAGTNPYRDLPNEPATHHALKELLYIQRVLNDGLLPTSLPDDDYELFSRLLRSLETRTDISHLVAHETRITQTMIAIANRGGYSNPIPDEPFDLQARAVALHHYWSSLRGAPERWEPAFDTTFLPPLLEADKSANHILTPEETAEAERLYTKYRENRDRKVAYLKLHPPTPMAWAPVSDEPGDAHSAWDSVFPDGGVRGGRAVPNDKLVNNPKWKPIYRDLLTERVPFDWVLPEAPKKTPEEEQAELAAFMENFERENAIRDARRQRQDAVIQELKRDRELKWQEEADQRAKEEAEKQRSAVKGEL